MVDDGAFLLVTTRHVFATMTDSSRSAPVSAARHVDALPAGTHLAEFEIVALLGVGGFGMVYQAFDHSLHRAVAIKEYMPSALAGRADGLALSVRTPADAPAFEAGLKSFVGEARLLAQFDHPSLVKVFRFWEANHTAYMVMPLYSGMTFKQARSQMRAPPSEAWLRKVLWSVLGALRTLHDGHTLHRDISPDNIFLQDVGPPVLLDLGAARHAINDRDRKHTAVLKVNYAPIEQYASGDAELPQGPWSDLYSLAAVVYGCLCNDAPLPSTLRSIRDRMVPLARVAKTVEDQFGQEYSGAFVAAIAQALALRPEERPQSIDAFLQAMAMTVPPAALEHFDFRAELGDIWVEPTDQPGPGLAVTTVDLASAALPPHAAARAAAPVPDAVGMPPRSSAVGGRPADAGDTVLVDAGDTVLLDDGRHHVPVSPPEDPAAVLESARPVRGLEHHRAASAGGQARVAKSSGRTLAVGLLVGGTLAVLAAVWALSGGRTGAPAAVAPVEDILTEMADPAASGALAPASAAPDGDALAEATEPAASTALAASDAAPATPAFVPKTDPRAVSNALPRASAPRRAPVVPPAPVPAPAPQAPAPTPAPAPERPRPQPVRLCEDSSALTRSMCLRSECRQPVHANLPVCVEFRKQMEPLEVHPQN